MQPIHQRGPRSIGRNTQRGACGCSAGQPFDAEAAHRNLAHKFNLLSSVVVNYMAQAPMERAARNENAVRMARVALRIVGGKPTFDYPDCCLVGQKNGNGTFHWFCSGVLIHPRIVLTAGHCHAGGLVIDTVAMNVSDLNMLEKAEIKRVKTAVTNPLYLQTNRSDDITVIILREDATTTPSKVSKADELNAATATSLVGFGNSDTASTTGFGIKREVSVDFVSLRRKPEDNLSAQESSLGFDSSIEFVAGGEGHDSCNGDSGGPAYVAVGGRNLVAGLTSRATDIAQSNCGDGGIYTRIDSQLEFIRKVATSNKIDNPGV